MRDASKERERAESSNLYFFIYINLASQLNSYAYMFSVVHRFEKKRKHLYHNCATIKRIYVRSVAGER